MRLESNHLVVLVSAYACEPFKGSEPGVGWNFVRQICKFSREVWVVTRANNEDVIKAALECSPVSNVRFVYVDLPRWLSFWKRGSRRVHLYYYLWQFYAYYRVTKILKQKRFDIAHHVTLGGDYLFSFLCFLNVPYVWGPVGHRTYLPARFHAYNAGLFQGDFLKQTIQSFFRKFDPLLRLTAQRAARIVLIGKEEASVKPFQYYDHKITIMPAIGIEVFSACRKTEIVTKEVKIISAGNLIPTKGMYYAIRAAAEALRSSLVPFRYTVYGDGPEFAYLKKLVMKLGIENKVYFSGSVSHDTVLSAMREADIFLFPSFEGGAMVLLEAMMSSLPVISLNHGIYADIVPDSCAIKIKPFEPEQTVKQLASAINVLVESPKMRKALGMAAADFVAAYCSWDQRGRQIKKVYEVVLGAH